MYILSTLSKPTIHEPRSSSSPIATVPPELLAHIFAFVCLDSQPSHLSPSWQHSVEEGTEYAYPTFSAPLFLGKICGSWRDLAWSTPSLWQLIDLVLPIEQHALHAELLEEWLTRSKGLPLSITFRRDESVRAGNVAAWGDRTLPLFHLIANEWRRWKEVDLFVPHGFCTLRMETFQSSEMPLLRSVRLRGGLQQQHSPGPSFLAHAPNLRALAFQGSKFPPLSSSGGSTHAFELLTRLSVNGLCLHDVTHVMTHALNLGTLHIADSPAAPFIASPDQQKLSLARLTSLTVVRSALVSSFLDALDAPILHHLHLEGNPAKPLELGRIAPFIRRKGRALQTLVLAGFSEGGVEQFVEHVPALRRLTLHREGTRDAERFQFTLAVCVGSHLLPELEYLEFHGAVYPQIDVIYYAVQRRWGTLKAEDDRPLSQSPVACRKITELVLSAALTPEVKAEAKKFLQGEIQAGLDLRFRDWAFTPSSY